MLQQQQKGIPPTIPKDPTDDHETNWVKNTVKNTCYHSFFFLLLLKRLHRNPYLPSVTVGPLNRLSATVKLHTIHKTFLLTIPSVKNAKFATHKVMQMLLHK